MKASDVLNLLAAHSTKVIAKSTISVDTLKALHGKQITEREVKDLVADLSDVIAQGIMAQIAIPGQDLSRVMTVIDGVNCSEVFYETHVLSEDLMTLLTSCLVQMTDQEESARLS